MIQGSSEWYQARAGRATASCFGDILAKGQGKTRAKYLRQVLAERLTGKPVETYHNDHMSRGQEQEPFARIDYEVQTGVLVQEVGFIQHETLLAGCSPDGLVGDEGGVEAKSVIPTVQLETILRGEYPPEHKPQIQGSFWITGRAWWDFCSYCPDMPEHLRLYVYRVTPDADYIAMLEKEVRTFLNEVDRLYAQLMQTKSLTDLLVESLGDAHALCTQP